MIKKFDIAKLKELKDKADNSDRKRANYNFHNDLNDNVNRLFNFLSSKTYIRPHCHKDASKWELILPVSGKVMIVVYDNFGVIVDKFILSSDDMLAFELPPNIWHSMYPITDNACFFEIKPGPFSPTSKDEFTAWSPAENSENVDSFLEWLKSAKIGMKYNKLNF